MNDAKLRQFCLSLVDARDAAEFAGRLATPAESLRLAALTYAVTLRLRKRADMTYVLDGRLRFVLGDDGGLQVEQVSRVLQGEVA